MLHSILNIKSVKPYTITIEFDNGEIKTINLEMKLREWSQSPESKFKYLIDPGNFIEVSVEPELHTICWKNGIDLCPDVLYAMG
ncbi:MAG: DUF2442 domain-containing protein [Bacteroidetes bacterium]|nr:DUF2442 domain-containing protein [Bacteroidota bacterium]